MTRREGFQYVAAGAALILVAVMAVNGLGPFKSPLPQLTDGKEPSLWFFLLSDGLTVGFVRLGVITLALYVFIAIPVLVVAGRWPKGFGKDGLTIDDAAKIDESKSKLEEALAQRDEWRGIAKRALKR